MSQSAFRLWVGHASHTGQVREVNEDSYLALTAPALPDSVDALFIVGDGVGGENAGEVASGTAINSFWDWFSKEQNYNAFVHYDINHQDYFLVAMKDLIEHVNAKLYDLAHTYSEYEKMGTTLTAGLLSGNRLFLGHAGDSRAYLFRQGTLTQLSTDHTWVMDEVVAGRMSEADALVHPRKHVVSRVLGRSLLLRAERQVFTVEGGDWLLFASDGLTGLVSDAEIQNVLATGQHPQKMCRHFIKLANHRGGDDNITVIVAYLQGEGSGSDLTAGVAVNSVHLGENTTPVPIQPPARPAQPVSPVTEVLTVEQPPSAQPRFSWQGKPLAFLLSILWGMIILLIGYLWLRINLRTDVGFFIGFTVALSIWAGHMTRDLFP